MTGVQTCALPISPSTHEYKCQHLRVSRHMAAILMLATSTTLSHPTHPDHCLYPLIICCVELRRWPGQVMDTARAHPTQLKARRSGLLVAFFGDNSWGWFTPDLLVGFSEHAEEKCKQRTGLKVWSYRIEPARDDVRHTSTYTVPLPHPGDVLRDTMNICPLQLYRVYGYTSTNEDR